MLHDNIIVIVDSHARKLAPEAAQPAAAHRAVLVVVEVPLRLLRQPRREAARVEVVAARRGLHALVAELPANLAVGAQKVAGAATAAGDHLPISCCHALHTLGHARVDFHTCLHGVGTRTQAMSEGTDVPLPCGQLHDVAIQVRFTPRHGVPPLPSAQPQCMARGLTSTMASA